MNQLRKVQLLTSSRQVINQRYTQVYLTTPIKMNTQENNKLIAEFMGDYNFEHTEGGLPIGDFSNSWDWLMPVVRKCFQTGDDTHEWDNIMDTLFTCDRDIVYAQVVEFINQLNK